MTSNMNGFLLANIGAFEALFANGSFPAGAAILVAAAALVAAGLGLRFLLSKRKSNEKLKRTNMQITAFGATHIGGRSNNEDAFLLRGDAYIVADGMGGMACGEEASAAAIGAFQDTDLEQPNWFEAAVTLANLRMRDLVTQDPRRKNLGTTVTAVRRVGPNQLHVGWSGDSPLFRLRAGVLEQLTEDHSLAVCLWKAGKISEAEIATSPYRNVLHKCVNGDHKLPEWEEKNIEIEAGDRYLICSDGLTDYSELSKVAAILGGAGTVEERVQALIDNALADNTKDNATAIVIDVA
jgi:protein phosphatase